MRKFEVVCEKELEKFKGVFTKEDITLPKRQTLNSCGYDVYIPYEVTIKAHSNALIYTGIKCCCNSDEFVMICIRSSMAIKRGLSIVNQQGIIDCDYYGNPDNDGHIMFAFYNVKDEDITIKKGEAIGQGVFMKYLITDNDKASGNRMGGFGSTDKL